MLYVAAYSLVLIGVGILIGVGLCRLATEGIESIKLEGDE